MVEKLISKFLDKKSVFALVGASNNHEKFGNIIYKFLKDADYTVYPINPNEDYIEGDKCYHDLANLPQKPDVVDMIVPPAVTEAVVRKCKELDIKGVWMQPGSSSDAAIEFCQENGIDLVHHSCVMVEIRKLS